MKNKIESIQALRGVGAIAIILYHFRYFLRGNDNSGGSIYDILFSHGIVGVDLFFSLSGFILIITSINTNANLTSSINFLKNRAIRIIPMYYVGLLIALLPAFIGGDYLVLEKNNILSAMIFNINNITTSPNYIPYSGVYNIRWTLNYEILFYIIFSISLLFNRKLTSLFILTLLPLLFIPYIYGVGFDFSSRSHVIDGVWISFISNPIIIEFLIGCFAGVAYCKLQYFSKNTTIQLITMVIAIILFVYTCYKIAKYELLPLNIITSAFFSVVIFCMAMSNDILIRYIPKFMIYVGDISFSLYLVHLSICTLIFGLAWKTNITGSVIGNITIGALSFLISFLVSIVTHRYIEIEASARLKMAIIKKA